MVNAPLIPRKILFGNPERMSPQMSPDGQWLAYLAPDEKDVLQVWLRSTADAAEQKLTADPKRGIRSFFWTYLPDQLVFLQDKDGDENFHLYSVNVRTRDVRDLTPYPGVRADVVAVEPQVPRQILVALNRNNPQKHDVYRIPLDSHAHDALNAAVLDTDNPGNVLGWVPDAQLQVRAAIAATPDGGHEIWWRAQTSDAWKTILTLAAEDQGQPLDFSADGQTLYLLSSHNANTQRLLAWEALTQRFIVLAEDSHYDVGGVFMHPTRRVVQAVSFNKDKVYWQILDPAIKDDFETLKKFKAAEIHPAHGDLADKQWIVTYAGDAQAAHYYVYVRAQKEFLFLFSQRNALDGLPLVAMKPVEIETRDKLTMHGYLSLPVTLHPPLPAVLLVHGGPWVRDRWGFNGMVQWLANRGYAVLQLNYRGSAGYGKAFLNAGNREWGAKMQDDLVDGVRWLVDEKIADPQRIAIMGGSYGGYAALAGLTFTPDTFACGVDIVGPSNLKTLIQTIPPYWEPMKASFSKRVGDLADDEFLKSRSPFFHADKITKPLLIGQGANDPRVKQAESDQIVAAMRAKKLPVDYWVYADEGHGFARPENRLHFYARVEAFLAAHLGGAAEPPDDPVGHTGVSQ